MLKSIEVQGKLTDELNEKILAAQTAKAYDSFVNAAEEEHHEHD